jgi:hypothetical protein
VRAWEIKINFDFPRLAVCAWEIKKLFDSRAANPIFGNVRFRGKKGQAPQSLENLRRLPNR